MADSDRPSYKYVTQKASTLHIHQHNCGMIMVFHDLRQQISVRQHMHINKYSSWFSLHSYFYIFLFLTVLIIHTLPISVRWIAHKCTSMHLYVCMYACMYVCMYVCINANLYLQLLIHKYIVGMNITFAY